MNIPGSPILQLAAPLDTNPISSGPVLLLYFTSGDPESPGQGPPASFPMTHIFPGACCCEHSLKLSICIDIGARFSSGVGYFPSSPQPPTQPVVPGGEGLRASLMGRMLVKEGGPYCSSTTAMSLVRVECDQNAQPGQKLTPLQWDRLVKM